MSIRELPSDSYQVRLMIDGRRLSATLPSRQKAEEWEILTRAQAITGALPRRQTVREYAARWLAGYETSPENTRSFHATNLKHITASLGRTPSPE